MDETENIRLQDPQLMKLAMPGLQHTLLLILGSSLIFWSLTLQEFPCIIAFYSITRMSSH